MNDLSQIVESEQVANFFIGKTKSGKTVLFHFLEGKKALVAKWNGSFFETMHIENEELKNIIENNGISHTNTANYIEISEILGDFQGRQLKFSGKLCDLPGLSDNRGNEKNFENLLIYQSEIEKAEKLRFIIVVEEGLITTGNASEFFKLCNEVISIFGLKTENAQGMHLVVTKTSSDHVSNLANIMKICFPKESNFIIEGIKNNTLRISSFDKPKKNLNNDIYYYDPEIRSSILRNICETGFIYKNTIRLNMLQDIFSYLDKIKSNPQTTGITFLSRINVNNNPKLEFENILVIDCDIDIHGNYLEIDGPTIIVQTLHEKRHITLRYNESPTIKFSPKVEKVINSEYLVLTTANTQFNDDFIDPKSNEFEESHNHIRLESILINTSLIEHLTLNNKYIDLIVSFNRNFGSIDVGNYNMIKKITCDINMKLHINECMNTKDNIINQNKSLRHFKNVATYLKEAKNIQGNNELEKFLESYVVNLPSIFEIFMKPSYFNQISTIEKEKEDLKDIRKMFIDRYLNLITDIKLNVIACDTEVRDENYEHLIQFIKSQCNFEGEISKNNKTLINAIDDSIANTIRDSCVDNFLKYFYALSLKKTKLDLFKYHVTGDISDYINFNGFINAYEDGRFILENQGVNIICIIPEIALAAVGAVLGYKIASLWGLNSKGGGLAGAIIFSAAGIFFYWIRSKLVTGYYNNGIKIEIKDIRIDCRLNSILVNAY
ncbi:hypothetical protein SteCoe_23696 [Stentor coeruleus]|uniref:Uncharacterized protein n=1 Tax=Stentor coeruleus TaxID=5963 RepID=A0A1R2BJC5_9CILI|nr:hypothetical protein SteCoe_23696 [Stentor coeruleus]